MNRRIVPRELGRVSILHQLETPLITRPMSGSFRDDHQNRRKPTAEARRTMASRPLQTSSPTQDLP